MSSVEIEDVLSSIRRLVSEDLRPAPASAARPAPEAAVPPAPASAAQMAASKLILTPALRVVADDAATATVKATPDPAPETDAESWDDGEVAAFVNVEDDAVFDNDPEWQTSAAVVSLTRPADIPAPDPVAEIVSDVPPANVDAPAAMLATEAMDWVYDTLPETPSPAWQDVLPEDMARPDDVAEEAAEDAVWADAAEAEVLRQLADEGVTPQAAPLSDDDRVYEENLLRDLVRDIIREELQGELGERITRNVRKLVRAEIARAMALRDFD